MSPCQGWWRMDTVTSAGVDYRCDCGCCANVVWHPRYAPTWGEIERVLLAIRMGVWRGAPIPGGES